jgi:hypothetical protein
MIGPYLAQGFANLVYWVGSEDGESVWAAEKCGGRLGRLEQRRRIM